LPSINFDNYQNLVILAGTQLFISPVNLSQTIKIEVYEESDFYFYYVF